MDTELHTYRYENGDIQKVQEVILDDFDCLDIFKPVYDKKSFDNLCDLFENFIITKYAMVFGKIILFTLPDGVNVPFKDEDEEYGHIYSEYAKTAVAFKKSIKVTGKKLKFTDKTCEDFYNYLKDNNCLRLVEGRRNSLDVMPVGKNMGFMTKTCPKAKLKVNSSFFVMDKFDCATVYDVVGTGIGLSVKNGKIFNPPMYDRETLMVDGNDKVSIRKTSLKDVEIIIDGKIYRDGEKVHFLSRPNYRKSVKGGIDIVAVDNRVVAVKKKGNAHVPSGGYIIHLDDVNDFKVDDVNVTYKGFTDLKFALQVGNSAIVDGVKTTHFISPFYDFRKLIYPAYPPSMYPLKYDKDRAPRIVLGVKDGGRPCILWFEGAGKFGYKAGKESCGVSLKEVADICEELNIVNAINLDGGGSAEILIENKRFLKISDRVPETFEEKERAIPYGLIVK